MRRTLGCVVCCASIIGCSSADDASKTQRGGTLSLVRMDGLGSSSAAQEPTPGESRQALSSGFDLGDVKVSQSFFFLLQNGGGADITDIALSTGSPAFTISPASIATLPVSGASAVPVLRLGVLHGVALDGVGLTALLPPGESTATLHIEGQTQEPSGSVTVALDATMTVQAKVMDAEISVDGNVVDLAHPGLVNESDQFTGEGPFAMIPGPATGTIAVKNTGNVVLDVATKYGAGNHYEPWGASQSLDPGESASLPYDPSKLLPQGPFSIRLGGENAIASPNRLLQSSTGFVYVAFYAN